MRSCCGVHFLAFEGGADGADVRVCWVSRTGGSWGTSPRQSGWDLSGAAGEHGEHVAIGEHRWQRDLYAGRHLGDAGGDFDQGEADCVELGLAPERGLRREAAQGVHEPVGGGVDQQAELIGRRL